MADQARGDDVYQPTGSGVDNPPDDALDMENALDERGLDATLDEGYSPPERPYAVEDYGTTQDEQAAGETLDRRLAREQPEARPDMGDDADDLADEEGEPWTDGEAGDARTGRLAEDDDPLATRGNRTLGRDVGIDGGAASAEEAAVHTIDDEG
ncbi:DUF5709 domain-containing protein [Yinghuangia sp. ASG 101]|uniref:DUF5709 domain-containing protein n=1 Tax=Yinghuangia sp. ASG 101 TaxID=2896848 RepID=UPI001E387F75|nr:DUF5709 domain-containing protein [Yinghuangia sp. ASG 101]UGQ12944.1 DUF5709 domain-containing protein [Yinghuangia sp. ASG 101]